MTESSPKQTGADDQYQLDKFNRWGISLAEEVDMRYGLDTSPITCFVKEGNKIPEIEDIFTSRARNGIIDFGGVTNGQDSFVKAVIARETLMDAMPKEVICQEWFFDLACEFGREKLEAEDNETWLKLWRSESHQKKLPQGFYYYPVWNMIFLRRLSGSRGLDELVNRAIQFAKHGLVPELEDWTRFITRFALDYTVHLSEPETIIASTLLREPNADNGRLAEKAGISEQWTGELLRRLVHRGQLVEHNTAVFSRIGLRYFQVFIEPDQQPLKECVDVLRWYPFTYSMSIIVSGKRGIHASICIPDHWQNTRTLDYLLKLAKSKGMTVNKFERKKSTPVWFLDNYNPFTGGWNIDWLSIGMEAETVKNLGITEVYPQLMKEVPKRADLEPLDIDILKEYIRGKTTVREIRTTLGGRTQEIQQRLRRLQIKDIVRRLWELRNVGLNEEIIVTTTDVQTGNCISSVSLRLPNCYIDRDDRDHLLMRAKLPKGGHRGFAEAMERLDSPMNIMLLGRRFFGGWRLQEQIENWDAVTGRWNPAWEKIDDWKGRAGL